MPSPGAVSHWIVQFTDGCAVNATLTRRVSEGRLSLTRRVNNIDRAVLRFWQGGDRA